MHLEVDLGTVERTVALVDDVLDAAALERRPERVLGAVPDLVGADALPPELLAKIPESTQGNPLFVRELMRMLVDDGVIAERDGTWEMVIDVDAVEVPPTVNTLLASRVERLADDERQVLELAAVVGSDFPMGAVAAADPDPRGLRPEGPRPLPQLHRRPGPRHARRARRDRPQAA